MKPERDVPVYPISTAAKLTGVDARRIRSWEDHYKLIKPARTNGGHRMFSDNDIEMLKRIRYLIEGKGIRPLGVRNLLEAKRT